MEQATLATADELNHLEELDPKLWAALSCPASGLEFDARTSALLDSDHDGRIRMPEIVAAVSWACQRLKDPALLAECPETLPVDAINEENEPGRRIAAAARAILEGEGTDALSREIVEKAIGQAAGMPLNGDGIIPLYDGLDDGLRQFIELAFAVVGSVPDTSGAPGLNLELSEAFVRTLKEWQAWRAAVAAAPHPAGADTQEAWALLEKIRGKVNEYFMRCQLASFAPEAADALNDGDRLLEAVKQGTLAPDLIAALPLAQVAPDGDLNLVAGANPLWRQDLRRFAELTRDVAGGGDILSPERWKSIQEAFAPYGAALAARPAPVAVAGVETPAGAASALDALGDDGVAALLAGDAVTRFAALVEEDFATPAAGRDLVEVEKLVLYTRYLHRLLMNFVSFQEFYSMQGTAVFQTGTLYIDGRSCRLCLPVSDVAKHASLADLSQLCLVYCTCQRLRSGGDAPSSMNIVAAVTSGDDALIKEGRNGVFVDNAGEDWDATVVKVVRNPISLREAMWAPYRRISALIGEQLAKFAANKSTAVVTGAGQKIGASAASIGAGTAPSTPFDIGKSVGIFAAVGIALGALGTAIGSIASALLELRWWQFPILLAGIFIIISGPSMFLAWLKLRRRTLGPLLEASGWAVNSQLPINLKLGSILTMRAELPENVTSRAQDPFRDEQSHLMRNLLIILIAGIALGIWLWQSGRLAGIAGWFSKLM